VGTLCGGVEETEDNFTGLAYAEDEIPIDFDSFELTTSSTKEFHSLHSGH
jgi:hypothetical protein